MWVEPEVRLRHKESVDLDLTGVSAGWHEEEDGRATTVEDIDNVVC